MVKLSSQGKTIDRKDQERVEEFLLRVNQLPVSIEKDTILANDPRQRNYLF
jgi:hypothetical protein